MAWTDPKTWSTNDVLSASDMNTYVRDNGRAASKLTSYTPTWGASTTNPTIGNGTLHGRYFTLEEWCWFQILITMGSTSTGGSGTYSLTLPVAAATIASGTEQPILCHLNRVGVSRYLGLGFIFTAATTFNVAEPSPWASTFANFWSNTSPFTFQATGNVFAAQGIYRRV
jgi:hypothetical protein